MSVNRRKAHWPDLPEKPAWQKSNCVGQFRPAYFDPHGTPSNYVAGCRCRECLAGHERYGRIKYRRKGGNSNRNRARKYVDPAYLLSWPGSVRGGKSTGKHFPRLGGPWLLFYAVLLSRD